MRRLALFFVLACASCSREAGIFVTDNARAHVGMLAGTIGSRPVGTEPNKRAREYIVDQLRQFGYEVRVQETDARRHELGSTAHVANIIAVLPGERPEAVALVSHYDSSPDAPGATDDALGVAVSLEAARVFAGNARRRWTLFVLVTDGEERGLMGAAGLVTDREVMNRLQAYVNVESIGSADTAVLFETGPGNAWLVSPWARKAPHPRGGSYALEIYRRLPNDTDFSMLKTADVPGLNFAAVGDSYAYHTARDTPERLTRETIRTTGENVVTLLAALQEADVTTRQSQSATFFDIGGTVAVSYGPVLYWVLSALALALGVVAWVRVTGAAIHDNGVLRWLLTLVWGWAGAALVVASMVGATWLLRSAHAVYHPWYARPGRMFLLLMLIGVTIGWSMSRLGQWLPRRAHPARHPALTWSLALPAWTLFAAVALWFAPAAAYLWVLPLFAAGLLLSICPPANDLAIRFASLLVLAVAGTLWLPETRDLLRFVVAVMGRLPIVTPVVTYAALLSAAGLMIVPPLIGLLATERPLLRPWLVTALLLLATAAATGAAYVAPPYTPEQPLRRVARVLQEADAPSAIWEVASVEPGLDLGPEAPTGWMPTTSSPPTSVPWGRFTFPFVFRTTGPAPAAVAAFALKPLPEGQQVTVSVVPREPGLTITFLLPAGVTPARSSLPGVQKLGRWTASFIAPPPEGISWEASFRGITPEKLREIHVAISTSRLPGGTGWQSLPVWLPQETAVWSATATWVIPASSGLGIAPVPALR
jgi:Peptidase family M28